MGILWLVEGAKNNFYGLIYHNKVWQHSGNREETSMEIMIWNLWRGTIRESIDTSIKISVEFKQKYKGIGWNKEIYFVFSDRKAPLYHQMCEIQYWVNSGMFMYTYDKNSQGCLKKIETFNEFSEEKYWWIQDYRSK